jgi:hypothetical protein
MSNENTIECLERLQEENDELRAEVEHHKKMYCVGCGACGDNDSYAEKWCTCVEEDE